MTDDTDDQPDRVAVPLRMPARLRARLRAEARRQGLSVNAVALILLDTHLPEHDPRKR